MAKAVCTGVKGHREVAHVVYDFAVDGGALNAEIDLFEIKQNSMIHDFWCEVETAVASLGAATLEVGVTGVDTDGVITQSAKTVFSADYVSGSELKGVYLFDTVAKADLKKKFTANTMITMLIGTAALTAGKIHFYCEFSNGY